MSEWSDVLNTEKLHLAKSANLSSVLILLDPSVVASTHLTTISTGSARQWFALHQEGRLVTHQHNADTLLASLKAQYSGLSRILL